jgi:hypothetical protein
MTRVLRSATKKIQNNEDSASKLSINNNSKNIKRSRKVEIEDEVSKQNGVWNNSSILYKILAYTDHEDLLKLNTVCKKWNHLTNPIIHKTVKLNRSWDIISQVIDKRLKKLGKIDTDVVECISNNAKHAHLVKKFKYDYKLEPRRTIEVFETFRLICFLTIENSDMSQDQFLGMISPLNQLQELNLSSFSIGRVIKNRIHKESVQLPPTLKKLRLYNIELINNPQLLIQTINSHRDLVEFSIYSRTNIRFLEPFYKNYPSLLNFEFNNNQVQAHQPLFDIFENNSQLINLKLSLRFWNRELLSHANNHLINLEELKLCEIGEHDISYTDFFAEFSQPTKIKKLNLKWVRLSNCSLNSILLNSPDLEELSLNLYDYYKRSNYVKFLNFSNPTKLKKFSVNCDILSEGVFETLILNSLHLNELNIVLPREWKGVMESIYEKCINLAKLNISASGQIYLQNSNDTFEREFYKSGFFTRNPKCRSTLLYLALNQFRAINAEAEYFKNFEKLKSIKYPKQYYQCPVGQNQKMNIDMGLWSGYRLMRTNDHIEFYDIELKRI